MMFFNFNRKENAVEKSGMKLTIDKSRCPQNHICPSIAVCPTGALLQKGFSAPTVDQEKCIQCGKCVRFCPKRALRLE